LTDGCSPFSNAAAVAGKIVSIERGLCGVAAKERNASNAAATIIYNNVANVSAAPASTGDEEINAITGRAEGRHSERGGESRQSSVRKDREKTKKAPVIFLPALFDFYGRFVESFGLTAKSIWK
jgi:hypothetical protein